MDYKAVGTKVQKLRTALMFLKFQDTLLCVFPPIELFLFFLISKLSPHSLRPCQANFFHVQLLKMAGYFLQSMSGMLEGSDS